MSIFKLIKEGIENKQKEILKKISRIKLLKNANYPIEEISRVIGLSKFTIRVLLKTIKS